MRGMTFGLAAVFLASAASGGAHAAVILNDGGTHAIDAPTANIVVSNHTTLDLGNGAVAAGIGRSLTTEGGAAVEAISSTLSVTGGMYTGGTYIVGDNEFPAHGLAALDSSVTISGGTFQGGATLIGGTFAVSGGTFLGGVGVSGVGTISGGSFVGAPTSGGPGIALGINNSGGFAITITGGSFQGPFQINFLADPHVQSLTLAGQIPFSFSGGFLDGILADGTTFHSDVIPVGIPSFTAINGNTITFFANPTPLATPEPAGLLMLSLGLAAVAGIGRSKPRHPSRPEDDRRG